MGWSSASSSHHVLHRVPLNPSKLIVSVVTLLCIFFPFPALAVLLVTALRAILTPNGNVLFPLSMAAAVLDSASLVSTVGSSGAVTVATVFSNLVFLSQTPLINPLIAGDHT